MNHAEIGALIAEKWNFPENLICAIRYHHDPVNAPKQWKVIVDTVYLANMICEYEKGTVTFEEFEVQALNSFGISQKRHIDTIIARFSSGFRRLSPSPN
jgi:HD-like signal output (HDOD) protein